MQMMQEEGLTQSHFDALCVGKAEAELSGNTEQTFFVVVRSQDLLRIRQALRARLIAAGGDASAFDPADFHPHITVGFTLRDLQESDGITKDVNSCQRS